MASAARRSGEAGELIVLQPGDRRTYRTRVGIIGAPEAEALRAAPRVG